MFLPKAAYFCKVDLLCKCKLCKVTSFTVQVNAMRIKLYVNRTPSAAFLAGRASIGSGFVRQFISSLRINNAKSLEGVTRGMAAGFAGAAVIGVFSFLFAALLINGIILLLGGGTMLTLQLTGVIKPKAKEAGTL